MNLFNHNNVRNKEQIRRMNMAEENNLCPFCSEGLIKIHQQPILHEIDGIFITKSAFPYNGTSQHYMIIPKEHITDISKLTSKQWSAVGLLLQWVQDKYKLHSGGLFIRFGDMTKTGSSVAHLHFQVLSGTKSEKDTDRESLKVKLGYK